MNTTRARGAGIPLTDELAGVVARMSGLLLTEDTVETSISLLSSLAAEIVPGTAGAGVSIIENGRRISSGSTDDRVREADALQYRLDEGPCLAATALREPVVVDDLREEPRWPRWAAGVLPMGLLSAASTPLVAGATTLGAIKVYAERPQAFADRSMQLLALFSAQAALLIANAQTSDRAARLSEGMRTAVRNRDLVAMAKGVLMQRHTIDEEAALRMLIARSQEKGEVLAAAARRVVDAVNRRRRP